MVDNLNNIVKRDSKVTFRILDTNEIYVLTLLQEYIVYTASWGGGYGYIDSEYYSTKYEYTPRSCGTAEKKCDAKFEEGTLNENSPLGKALTGKKIGDEFSYICHDGEIKGQILNISNY